MLAKGLGVLGFMLCIFGIPLPSSAEPVWSRSTGAWVVELDQGNSGATCALQTHDTSPPNHRRMLAFLAVPAGGLAIIASDRLTALHQTAPARVMIEFGGKRFFASMGSGLPLTGLPGGMLVGQMDRTDYADFAINFAQANQGRAVFSGGGEWTLSMRGSAAALQNLAACMDEQKVRNNRR